MTTSAYIPIGQGDEDLDEFPVDWESQSATLFEQGDDSEDLDELPDNWPGSPSATRSQGWIHPWACIAILYYLN